MSQQHLTTRTTTELADVARRTSLRGTIKSAPAVRGKTMQQRRCEERLARDSVRWRAPNASCKISHGVICSFVPQATLCEYQGNVRTAVYERGHYRGLLFVATSTIVHISQIKLTAVCCGVDLASAVWSATAIAYISWLVTPCPSIAQGGWVERVPLTQSFEIVYASRNVHLTNM
jgi:hypothetical protein